MSEPIIRKLRKEDLWNGFLTTLDSLRQASTIDKTKAEEIFEKINSNPDHIIAVAELDGKIVGTTTLLIESKFIHNGGIVGHIEDVVIDTALDQADHLFVGAIVTCDFAFTNAEHTAEMSICFLVCRSRHREC